MRSHPSSGGGDYALITDKVKTAAPAEGRGDFMGSSEQIAQLVLDVQFSPGIENVGDMLRRMEELQKLAA